MIPIKSTYIEKQSNKNAIVGLASMQGYRPTMEDNHAIEMALKTHPHIMVFGIFDGHGGNAASEFLRKELVNIFDNMENPLDPNEIIKEFILTDEITKFHSGSTIATVLVNILTKQITTINVGDSKIIVYNKDKLIFESIEHKPTTESEATRIQKAGGYVSQGRVDGSLALSRAFGDHYLKTPINVNPAKRKVICVPDIYTLEYTDEYKILICCDGLTDVSTSLDLVKSCNFYDNDSAPQIIASNLIHECLGKNSSDNLSALVVFLGNLASQISKVEKEWYYAPMRVKIDWLDNKNFMERYKTDAEKYGLTLNQAFKRSSVCIVSEKYNKDITKDYVTS